MSKPVDTRGLTKKWLAEQGYTYHNTEVKVPGARQTADLFGFVDCIGLREGRKVCFIQYTSWSNFSSRLRKILEEHKDTAEALLRAAGNQILVLAWRHPEKDLPTLKIAELRFDERSEALAHVETKHK